MPSTAPVKKKPRNQPPSENPEGVAAPTPSTPTPVPTDVTVEDDLVKVVFERTKVTYTIKKTGETLSNDYGNLHAVSIIHGRLSKTPSGEYFKQCFGKIRKTKMQKDVIL